MPAPDVNADVRARFEAAFCGLNLTRLPPGGDYYDDNDVDHLLIGYRAAHADLSGEVRELVEALRDTLRMLEAARRALGMVHTDNKRVQRARAALAKHTHQEKP